MFKRTRYRKSVCFYRGFKELGEIHAGTKVDFCKLYAGTKLELGELFSEKKEDLHEVNAGTKVYYCMYKPAVRNQR